MSRPNTATQLGFYGVFYLIFLLITVVTYGPAQEYLRPVTNLIFPAYEHNSLLKSVIVLTGMYWGVIGLTMFIQSRASKK